MKDPHPSSFSNLVIYSQMEDDLTIFLNERRPDICLMEDKLKLFGKHFMSIFQLVQIVLMLGSVTLLASIALLELGTAKPQLVFILLVIGNLLLQEFLFLWQKISYYRNKLPFAGLITLVRAIILTEISCDV